MERSGVITAITPLTPQQKQNKESQTLNKRQRYG